MARMILKRMSGRTIRPIGTRIQAFYNLESGMSSELINGKDEVQLTVARARSPQSTKQQRPTAGSDCPWRIAEHRAGTHSDLLKQANARYRRTVYLNSFTTAGEQATAARSRLAVILQRRSKSLFAGLLCLWHLPGWHRWAWTWIAYRWAVRAATVLYMRTSIIQSDLLEALRASYDSPVTRRSCSKSYCWHNAVCVRTDGTCVSDIGTYAIVV